MTITATQFINSYERQLGKSFSEAYPKTVWDEVRFKKCLGYAYNGFVTRGGADLNDFAKVIHTLGLRGKRITDKNIDEALAELEASKRRSKSKPVEMMLPAGIEAW